MIRNLTIEPDIAIETPNGTLEVVSLEALQQALLGAASVMHMNGGHVTVVTQRAPTGRPHESVTTGALLQWKDKTGDAARAAPEPVAPAAAAVDPRLAAQPARPPAPVAGGEALAAAMVAAAAMTPPAVAPPAPPMPGGGALPPGQDPAWNATPLPGPQPDLEDEDVESYEAQLAEAQG
jgi:hypothetical protein